MRVVALGTHRQAGQLEQPLSLEVPQPYSHSLEARTALRLVRLRQAGKMAQPRLSEGEAKAGALYWH